MEKTEIIRRLIDAGRARDVLEFVEGDSPYISETSPGAPQEPELRRLWILVVHHLRFISEFGILAVREYKDGRCLTAFPDEFEQWLQVGAPGISNDDIGAFLRDHPL